MKKKFIILFIIIFLIFIYFKTIKPYKQEKEIKAELMNKWDVDIGKDIKFKKMESSKPQWYGEHHKFILFELKDSANVLNYIRYNNLYLYKINFTLKSRITEIEDDLNIERKDRINFNWDYYYTKRIKYNNFGTSSEKTNDILYIILIKETDNAKMFIVEDLNVLDLEGSF